MITQNIRESLEAEILHLEVMRKRAEDYYARRIEAIKKVLEPLDLGEPEGAFEWPLAAVERASQPAGESEKEG